MKGAKLAFWKRWLSYFWEIRVAKLPSAYSQELELSIRNGRYQLSSPKAVYSHEDLYYNFKAIFALLPAMPKKVLVLGAGLGSVPILLEKQFGTTSEFTLVDIDPQVLGWLQRYGLPMISSPCELQQSCGLDWVAKQKTGNFELIAVDIFVDNQVPAKFETPEFLQHCARLLSPNGLLIYNRLGENEPAQAHNSRFFSEVFQPQFPQAAVYPVGSNQLFCSKHLG